MHRYTFSDAVPLAGSAGPLLTAAIASANHPRSLTQLSQAAGISKHAASRSGLQLQSAGLLREVSGGYELNRDHELMSVLLPLVWLYSGVRIAPDRPSGRDPAVEDYSYRPLIPSDLAQPYRPGSAARGGGPDLVTVRRTVTTLLALTERLRWYERVGQEVFAKWRNGRLQDIVHVTGDFSLPTAAAIKDLEAAARWEDQGSQDPHRVESPADVWVRATYLISAECRRVTFVLRLLEHAVSVGRQVNGLRREALRDLSHIARGSDPKEWLEEALAKLAAAEELWQTGDDASAPPFRNVGGSPTQVDVGTAGDQILLVQLLGLNADLVQQVGRMAEHPCVERWLKSHQLDNSLPAVVSEPYVVQRR